MAKQFIKYILRIIFIPIELLLGAFFLLFIYILFASQISAPPVPEITIAERVQVAPNHYKIGPNYLKKNDFGVWEMYIEGAPYERGLIYGKLAKELIQRQEDIFVGQINQFVPSGDWQQFLKLMLGFFNSELPNNIPLENQQEIYGISQSFSDKYDYIAPKYTRILNYHAAHDIGHALNDYSLVGCTSFALKGSKSSNNDLLIGRNFDFYVGDEFAEDKLIVFLKPDKGYAFATYSWAGFTGVASGLNEVGLSVTINASKSDLPTSAKMPISLLAREILQHAKNIDEAIKIAKTRSTFVSETLMIGSAQDKKAVLIEKSPSKIDVYRADSETLICSNHYQSELFKKDPINISNIDLSDSPYRFAKMQELLSENKAYTVTDAVEVLRNQNGEDGDTLGMGNPRAINQLIAHHSVVIQPEENNLYISTHDFQLGEFIGYNLSSIFKSKAIRIFDTIPESAFINSSAYTGFKEFKKTKLKITQYLMFNTPLTLSEREIEEFIYSNAESYVTYEMLGKYYSKKEDLEKAASNFKLALSKNVASKAIESELSKLYEQTSNRTIKE